MDISVILNFILAVLTLILGGGWFISYSDKKKIKRAERLKNETEAYELLLSNLTGRIKELVKQVDELQQACEKCKYKQAFLDNKKKIEVNK